MFESTSRAEDIFGVSPDLPDDVGVGGGVGSVLARLAEAPGSPGAMALLAGTDPAHLSVAQRVDLIRAWERQLAWAADRQLAAVAALEDPGADERPGHGAGEGVEEGAGEGRRPGSGPSCVPDWCREELSAALHLSGTAAQARLDLARDLRGRLPGTAAGLRGGQLTAQKAQLIAAAVRPFADLLAAEIETAVLPAAGTQTPGELRRAVARAVLVADPAGAAERAADAADRRRVSHHPLPDGMGGLWAELPAADTQTVLAGLDADADRIARALRAAGTPHEDLPVRSARRADALLAWARRALTEPDLPTTHGRRPHIHVTVAVTTLLGLDQTPGELAGYGPIDATTTRRIDADGTWRRLLTDPASGALLDYGRTIYQPPADLREFILARDPTCTFPGCQQPARRCQLDHLHERQHGGSTTDGNLHPLCLRHHTCKTIGGWTVTRDDRGTTTWTSPTGHIYTHGPTALAPPRRADAPTDTTGSQAPPASRGPTPAACSPSSSGQPRTADPPRCCTQSLTVDPAPTGDPPLSGDPPDPPPDLPVDAPF